MTAVASHGLMGIGDVLAALRPEFPDVTISKIRFLESEGLVMPQRTSSGYRKFSHADVERLRYVLACQRDQYLPLKVIRDHLEAIDRGLEPSSGADGPRVPRALVSTDGMPSSESFRPGTTEVRLSRGELLESSGLDDALLTQLEGYGLVTKRGSHYDGEALVVASTVAEARNESGEGMPSVETSARGTVGPSEPDDGSRPRSIASRWSRMTLSGRYWSRWLAST